MRVGRLSVMPTLRALLDVLGPAVAVVTGDAGLDAEVSGVVLVGPGDPLPSDPHALLVCTDPDVLGQPVRAAGVVVKPCGRPTETWQGSGVPVLVADEALPWSHLLHLLSAATSPATTGDLFSLANAVAAAVGGAVSVEDPRRRVLAYSSLPGQPIDEARKQGILGRQVPDLSGNDELYRRLQRSAGLMHVPADGDVLPRVAVAVRSGSELLGSLWVVAVSPLGKDAEEALLHASRLAALHLLRARTSGEAERRARGELLRALLDGRSAPELAGSRLGIDAARPVTVLAFGLPEGGTDELVSDTFADLVHVQCAAVSAQSSVLVQNGTVYALVPGEHPRSRLVQLGGTVLQRALGALQLAVGAAVGTTVDGLGGVLRSRADADAVLRLRRTGAVVALEDVLPQVALLDLRTHLASAPHLRLPALAAMLAHDAEHETPYAESVLAYLAANADVPAAAAAVNVHPNTFRYRMRRVRELFDLDLEDPDVRLVAWLQLRTRT